MSDFKICNLQSIKKIVVQYSGQFIVSKWDNESSISSQGIFAIHYIANLSLPNPNGCLLYQLC